MSKRRELVRHIDSLADIGELLGAMRSLALAESRRISDFIEAQRQTAAIVREAFGRLLQDHGAHLAVPRVAGRMVCVVGSERGFCGDLNQRLVASALPDDASTRWVLVGSRLVDAWPATGPTAETHLPGAGIADEVLSVQTALVAALTPLLGASDTLPELVMISLGPEGVRRTTVLPAPPPGEVRSARGHPVDLNLPPRVLQTALLDQYLDAMLAGLLLEALLHENEQRLTHMDQARRNVDERLETLRRRANRARQEEITEEIEVILLAGQSGEDAPMGASGSQR